MLVLMVLYPVVFIFGVLVHHAFHDQQGRAVLAGLVCRPNFQRHRTQLAGTLVCPAVRLVALAAKSVSRPHQPDWRWRRDRPLCRVPACVWRLLDLARALISLIGSLAPAHQPSSAWHIAQTSPELDSGPRPGGRAERRAARCWWPARSQRHLTHAERDDTVAQ